MSRKTNTAVHLGIATILAVGLAPYAGAAPGKQGGSQHPKIEQYRRLKKRDVTKEKVDHLYGNHQCPVSGETVVPESFVDFRDEENNRYARIYLCCQGCEKKASQALPALYSDLFLTDKKSGKPIEARDLENSTCPVMEGEPVDPKVAIEYNGMIVRFHDPACIAAFLDDPRPGMKRLLPNDKEFEYRRSAGSGSHKHE